MASPDNFKIHSIQRAIELMEEALGILDAHGFTLAAAKLASALDSAYSTQMKRDGE